MRYCTQQFSCLVSVPEIPDTEEKMNVSNESMFLKSLEGFLLVLSPEGDFVYLSENVNEYLGITQVRGPPNFIN